MKELYQPGQEIETSIVAVTNDTIFLDLSLKTEGILDKAEVTDDNGECKYKEGDKIKVYYLTTKHDVPYFTTKIAGKNADKDMLEKAFNSGIPVQGHVEKEIKGGFEVKLGNARAFCPFSQMGYKQKEEPAFYIGKTLSFKIQEFKNEGKNIIVSNRAVKESEHKEGLAQIASKFTVGTTVLGTVIDIKEKGALVDIGGFDAFLPISEISRSRINKVSDKLEKGQEIKAVIINTDWDRERVSISTKELEANPWDTIENDFPAGTKFDGKIVRIADFGIFVNVAEGIDGLVHVSELNLEKGTNLKKKFNVGDTLSVIVKSVDAQSQRMSLTTSTSNEQDTEANTYMSNQKDDGDTYNPFAALLKK